MMQLEFRYMVNYSQTGSGSRNYIPTCMQDINLMLQLVRYL